MVESALFTSPNKYVLGGSLSVVDNDTLLVDGYNCYTVTKKSIIPKEYSALVTKNNIVGKFLTPGIVEGLTFLDLGAATGFYSILAAQNGAKSIAVDMDSTQLNVLKNVSDWFDFGIETHVAPVQDWKKPCDIVNALALIHWIYSCTARMGSLDCVIEFLSLLSKKYAFIEWVDPDDISCGVLRSKEGRSHIEFNKDIIKMPYSKKYFLKAIDKYFSVGHAIGRVSETREIYLCKK